MKAIWNNRLIAESDKTIVVEGNEYFPPDSVNREYLIDSNKQSICPWKGKASYYHLEIDGKINANAAWYYPEPSLEAMKIKGYIAFWEGVEVSE